MRNPAAELHAIFEKWKRTGSPRTAAYIARGLHDTGGGDSNAAFDEHIRAMRLLAECQNIINEMESNGTDVATFRRTLRLWAAAILHYPHNWQNAGEAAAPFKEHAMDTLSTLAILLEARGPLITVEGMSLLKQLLADVTDLLQVDDSISADMRAHVYAVVQTLRRYLDDVDMYGQADFKDAIRDLWVSLNAAAGQADEKHRSKWQAFVRDIGIPAAGTVMGSIPTLALEAVSLAAGS
jgi:hypothetical protein